MEDLVAKLAQLDQKGQRQLREGKWQGAAKTFRAMLELDEHPSLRNNLAFALHMEGLDGDALMALEPVLLTGRISPFSHALGAIIFTKLQEKDKAQLHLEKAIEQFEQGLLNPEALGFSTQAWLEYTVVIKRAAGNLGADRLVIDLHRKWERFYQTTEDYFQVGTAFFNLGYPQKAIKIWSPISQNQWPFLANYIRTAEVLTLGLIPRFTLPYTLPVFESGEGLSEDKLEKLLAAGDTKAMVLGTLFDPNFPEDAALTILELIIAVGKWGSSFGESVLQSPSLPVEWKMTAGWTLIKLGVLPSDEPVSMVIDGVERQILFS